MVTTTLMPTQVQFYDQNSSQQLLGQWLGCWGLLCYSIHCQLTCQSSALMMTSYVIEAGFNFNLLMIMII